MEYPIYFQGFVVLLIVCCGLFLLSNKESSSRKQDMTISLMEESLDEDLANTTSIGKVQDAAVRRFRINYLTVYFLVMLSDWLQGPYIYNLYKEYGYNLDQIALLFVTGFLSSAVFGTWIGSVADKLCVVLSTISNFSGRKRMCMCFCVIYSISCLTKLSPQFSLLLLGRITGGIATSLLFSVFESWMVKEYFAQGFSTDLLPDLFSWVTFLNGLSAIFSGVLANALVDKFGYVSPFMGAIFFLVVASLIIGYTWRENYGDNTLQNKASIMDAVHAIRSNLNIFSVGMAQCLFESAMYSFVFLWCPYMEFFQEKEIGESIPFGIIFSAMMISMMIGSIIHRRLSAAHSQEEILKWTLIVAGIALFTPCFLKSKFATYVSYNLFELSCGLYFPSMGSLRSKFVPEETRATTMNVFRIPLNLIVVVTLLKVNSIPYYISFFICGVLIGLSYLFVCNLDEPPSEQKK